MSNLKEKYCRIVEDMVLLKQFGNSEAYSVKYGQVGRTGSFCSDARDDGIEGWIKQREDLLRRMRADADDVLDEMARERMVQFTEDNEVKCYEAAFFRLPGNLRHLIIRRHRDKASFDDLGKETGVSKQAVHKNYIKAMQALEAAIMEVQNGAVQ